MFWRNVKPSQDKHFYNKYIANLLYVLNVYLKQLTDTSKSNISTDAHVFIGKLANCQMQ